MNASLLKRLSLMLLIAVSLLAAFGGSALAAGDPTGEILMAEAEDPASEALTFVWLTIAAVLVFFMQAGFGLVESGFAQAKNTVNIWSKNYMDLCIGGLAYFFFGYGVMYGTDIGGFIGSDGFLTVSGRGYQTYLGEKRTPGPRRQAEGDTTGLHFENFRKAALSRRVSDLNCDVLEGHLSAALCHLANISYRTGDKLLFDPETERFVGNFGANTLLKRDYRAPWIVPEEV